MVRVKSFLCCFSLECMGLFIGWSNVIFYAIAVLLLGVAALGFETGEKIKADDGFFLISFMF